MKKKSQSDQNQFDFAAPTASSKQSAVPKGRPKPNPTTNGKRKQDSAEANVSVTADEFPENDPRDRRYIVQDRDGDYIERVESMDSETLKCHFIWTPKREKARIFTGAELWATGDAVCIMQRIVQGYAGARAIRIA